MNTFRLFNHRKIEWYSVVVHYRFIIAKYTRGWCRTSVVKSETYGERHHRVQIHLLRQWSWYIEIKQINHHKYRYVWSVTFSVIRIINLVITEPTNSPFEPIKLHASEFYLIFICCDNVLLLIRRKIKGVCVNIYWY